MAAIRQAATTDALQAARSAAGFCGCLGGAYLLVSSVLVLSLLVAQGLLAAWLLLLSTDPLAVQAFWMVAGLEAVMLFALLTSLLCLRMCAARVARLAAEATKEQEAITQVLARSNRAARSSLRRSSRASASARSRSPRGNGTGPRASEASQSESVVAWAEADADGMLRQGALGSADAGGRASRAGARSPRSSRARRGSAGSPRESVSQLAIAHAAARRLQALWRSHAGRRAVLRLRELEAWETMSSERFLVISLIYLSALIFVLASTYVCLLFGFLFAPEQSRAFIMTSLAGFVIDLVVQKPLVIFLNTCRLLLQKLCKVDRPLCHNLSPTIIPTAALWR